MTICWAWVLTRGEDVCSQRPVAGLVRGHDPRHLGRNVRVVVPAAGPSVFRVEEAAALSVAAWQVNCGSMIWWQLHTFPSPKLLMKVSSCWCKPSLGAWDLGMCVTATISGLPGRGRGRFQTPAKAPINS